MPFYCTVVGGEMCPYLAKNGPVSAEEDGAAGAYDGACFPALVEATVNRHV